MTRHSFLTQLVFFCLCCCIIIISLSHALNNGFSVELIHRDSARSPLYHPTETQFQRVANAVRRSINRVNHLNIASVSETTPVTSVIPDRGEYLMTYSVGTPPFKLYGILDTGSDIVWLQCQPCEECYNQTSPMFNPSKSTTYRNIPCSSTTCQSIHGSSCSTDNEQVCEYNIQYGDKSFSEGVLGVETLTLDSITGSPLSFPKTVIGCGHNNTVSFGGQSSGVVGLGGGPVSLITQLSSSIGGKFSYCLVPLLSESNVTSKLSFGDAAVVSGPGTVSTPIFKGVQTSVFYYLTLEAFSVGNKRIEFGGGSSSFGSSVEGNIVIDSGTTLTLLPGDLYSRLESAVAAVVKLERVEDPAKQLSLCYRTTSEQVHVPVITAHFSGADVQLNGISTFIPVAEGIVCFAFRSSEIGVIFGNLAQQNLLVGYDLEKNTVSFKPTDCTKQ